jgi:hypothetical protein
MFLFLETMLIEVDLNNVTRPTILVKLLILNLR